MRSSQESERAHREDSEGNLVAGDQRGDESGGPRDASVDFLRGELEEPDGDHDVQGRLDQRENPLVGLFDLGEVLLVLPGHPKENIFIYRFRNNGG